MMRKLNFSVWVFFLMVFIGLGLKGLVKTIKAQPILSNSPYATTDSILRGIAVSGPSESIMTILSEFLPEDILFVGSGNDTSFLLTYYTINYLSWPRRVWAIGCDEQSKFPTLTILSDKKMKIAAVIFYSYKPPAWMPEGRALGPRLTLVPVSEVVEWTSYCSQ